MLLLLLSETAYFFGMGGGISPIPGRPENIFLNPASMGSETIYITFYRPFNVEDFYKGDFYAGFHYRGIFIGLGINATRVNRQFTRLKTGFGIKWGFLGFSLYQRYTRTGDYSSFEPFFDYNTGLNLSFRSFSLSISKERLGIGFISDKGIITLETEPDFHHIYAGAQFIVNRVISGSVGWKDGNPTIGLYLSNPRFDIEMGFLTNPDLGETTIVSVGWKL